MSEDKLTYAHTVNAAPRAVYRAFTSATALREWLCNGAVANVREGGSYHLWWNDGYYTSGAFTTLDENTHVTFTWRGRDEADPTTVDVTLEGDDDKTSFTLTHSGEGESWPAARAEYDKGWQHFLENLISVLEDGIDLRLARRPMLGIVFSRFIDEEAAGELGLPVNEGTEISTTIDGMGAQQVGLRTGDVLYKMDDTVLSEGQAFVTALEGKQAGDEVEVVYYRKGEKHTVTMPLSARQMPDVPDDPAQLAAQLAAIYQTLDDEIEELVGGLTDKAASHAPADGEWNVKQILAHLILSDRGTNQWVATLISGNEMVNFPGNVRAQHDAVVAAYPAISDLLAELRRVHAEIVTMVKNLPQDFVQLTSTYVRMGQSLLQTGYHPRSHHDQLKATIAAATDSQPA